MWGLYINYTSGKTHFAGWPLYVWMPPYVWMFPVCLDAPICLYTPHMFGCPHVWTPPCFDAPCMFGHLTCLDVPCMFGHFPYVWMPPICLDTPCICLDIPCMFGHPICLNTPICLDAPHVWMAHILKGCPYAPNTFIPPYVWTPSIFLDAPCTYTTQRKHALSH